MTNNKFFVQMLFVLESQKENGKTRKSQILFTNSTISESQKENGKVPQRSLRYREQSNSFESQKENGKQQSQRHTQHQAHQFPYQESQKENGKYHSFGRHMRMPYRLQNLKRRTARLEKIPESEYKEALQNLKRRTASLVLRLPNCWSVCTLESQKENGKLFYSTSILGARTYLMNLKRRTASEKILSSFTTFGFMLESQKENGKALVFGATEEVTDYKNLKRRTAS